MNKLMPACCAVCVSISLVSCEQPHRTTSEASPAHQQREAMNGQDETPPPRDTVSKVMQAKLAHSQAMLEGIALADFTQIQANAQALKQVSESAEWLAHESVTYFDMSAEFRRICDDSVSHARAKDLQALTSDYTNLTHSCVTCHTYLRSARPFKDMPGRVSSRSDPRSDIFIAASLNSAQ